MAAADASDVEAWVASTISATRIDEPTDEAFAVLLLDLTDEAKRDGRANCAVLPASMATAGPRRVAEAAGHTR